MTDSASFGESGGVSRTAELWSPHPAWLGLWDHGWGGDACVSVSGFSAALQLPAPGPQPSVWVGREQAGAGFPQQSAAAAVPAILSYCSFMF